MISESVENVRSFLISYLSNKIESEGKELENNLPDDYDLLLNGVIDSTGLLELILSLEEHFGVPIDFEELDAEEITVVGPFCRFVANEITKI